MNTTSRVQTLIKAGLILCLIAAMYLQRDVGMADNGDFTRSMGWISPGPVGIEPNWPAAGTEEWVERFNNYWLPYWKLDWQAERPTTSSFLLWLPGAVFNYLFYSRTVLYLPLLSLFSRLILLGILLMFIWIGSNSRYATLLLLSLGVPVVLLWTNTEYIAYFNSFYLESASFVFLFLLLSSLLFLKRRPSLVSMLCSLAAVLLLATAKPANFYWPMVAVPFVFYVWSPGFPRKKGSSLSLGLAGLGIICLFTFLSSLVTSAGSNQANPYNSLFDGVLRFSRDPSAHLRDLGMETAEECVVTTAFTPTGAACLVKYQNKISYKNTVLILSREPLILFRMLGFALDTMQDLSVDYLGKYAIDDPRSQTSPPVVTGDEQQRFWPPTAESGLLNAWASLKFRLFPTGYALAFVLICFLAWFLWNMKRTGLIQDLALIGLLCTVACLVDMTITILGDGMVEVVRHLFLANLLFDVALLAFLNSILLAGLQRLEKRSSAPGETPWTAPERGA